MQRGVRKEKQFLAMRMEKNQRRSTSEMQCNFKKKDKCKLQLVKLKLFQETERNSTVLQGHGQRLL
eukprot:12202683-Ditylum_brightwellii.AAC.1